MTKIFARLLRLLFVRCPHCEAQVRRDDEKVMAYPWTPNEDPDGDRTMILRRIEEEPIPHDTISAPAELTGNRRKAKGHRVTNTAPPFLFIKGKEKQNLLSGDDHRRGRPGKFRPPLYMGREDQELIDQISPNDSISNVGIHPFRSRYHDTDRLHRPSHSAYSEGYFRTSPRRVEDSPRSIRYNAPRRQFDGHYVDIRNGKKYKYKVNYMDDGQVDSERRLLRSL